ncbi:MAG: hypothetical protein SVU32_03925 [Candidatus Nanohaloarchaea archaeon]|nr:hypothetical protein [Candidatus Nanohaloarchaea archaeon]
MADETFCGIVLSGDEDQRCGLAFLSDRVETFSETDDDRILELIEERRPAVIAFTAPLNEPGIEGFREDEEELVDEGYRFLPPDLRDRDEMERTQFMMNAIKRLGFMPEVIECRPKITADILDIEGDDDLEEFGVETGAIHNMTEFEAVLAAITAKFYENDQFRDKGVIVPEEV